MTDERELVERRDHERFEVPQGAYVTLGPRGKVMGKIVDISMSGVAFGFIDGEKPSKDLNELDMLFMDSGFSMRKIRFDTIWNFRIPNEVLYNDQQMRRCGVKFKKMNRDQTFELKCFIESHNIGNVVIKPS
jgi:hypothetical protein